MAIASLYQHLDIVTKGVEAASDRQIGLTNQSSPGNFAPALGFVKFVNLVVAMALLRVINRYFKVNLMVNSNGNLAISLNLSSLNNRSSNIHPRDY